MNRENFVRRDVLLITALLSLSWLAGELYAYDLLPDVIYDAIRYGMLPVWILVHELQTSIVSGGMDGLKEVLVRTYRPTGPAILFVLDVNIVIVVSYLVAIVNVHVGSVLVSLVDAMPDVARLKPVLGTIITVGVI